MSSLNNILILRNHWQVGQDLSGKPQVASPMDPLSNRKESGAIYYFNKSIANPMEWGTLWL